MKKINIFLIIVFFTNSLVSQNLIGAWESIFTSESGKELKSVVIFSEGFQSISTYELNSGKFISSNGGTWSLDNDIITEQVEFDTENPERVGDVVSFEVMINDTEMSIVGSNKKFKRIDDGRPGMLNGAWLMSGRIRDGQKQLRDINRPRKTMKILSGTRFQWIAYNTASKKFMGTGGGTYTTIDGKYTEHIEFFSRDDSKVDLKLNFEFNLENEQWQHIGFSSKGDPLHEIWVKRK